MTHIPHPKWVADEKVLEQVKRTLLYCHFVGSMLLGCVECACSLSCQKRTILYHMGCMQALAIYLLSELCRSKGEFCRERERV